MREHHASSHSAGRDHALIFFQSDDEAMTVLSGVECMYVRNDDVDPAIDMLFEAQGSTHPVLHVVRCVTEAERLNILNVLNGAGAYSSRKELCAAIRQACAECMRIDEQN